MFTKHKSFFLLYITLQLCPKKKSERCSLQKRGTLLAARFQSNKHNKKHNKNNGITGTSSEFSHYSINQHFSRSSLVWEKKKRYDLL